MLLLLCKKNLEPLTIVNNILNNIKTTQFLELYFQFSLLISTTEINKSNLVYTVLCTVDSCQAVLFAEVANGLGLGRPRGLNLHHLMVQIV